jgi:YD repeat-containing protein
MAAVVRLHLGCDDDGGGLPEWLPDAITNANGHAVTNSYNPAGLVTGVTSAAGSGSRYQRDDLGTVTSIRNRDGTGTQTTSFGVNNRGWVNSITYPDSI